jgi:hypothetical protein
MSDGLERAALDGVIAPLVPVGVPAGRAACEHRGVLPEQLLCSRVNRAPDSRSNFIPRDEAGRADRRQVSLLQPDILEHRLRDGDVFSSPP